MRGSHLDHKYYHMMSKSHVIVKISSRTYYYIWYNLTQIRPILIRTGKCFLNSAFECLETYLVWSSILFSTAKYHKGFESYHFLISLHNSIEQLIRNIFQTQAPYLYEKHQWYKRLVSFWLVQMILFRVSV